MSKSKQMKILPDNVDAMKITGPGTEKQFLVRAPRELIEICDELFKFNGFTSRNEFVVHCIKVEINRIRKRRK